MFKKSLAALAVLGAAAGYASAADVTLFGVVDTGLIYTHQTFADDSKADVNKFAMDSGVSSASRFGLKGTEELGNGLKVGFKLENGFQSDSGALKSEKRIFDREASVSLYSDFGTLSMGRMGGVGSGAGTYDLVLATADAFDGGDNNVFGFATSDRYDNMVTYQTPKFAGLQATVQYSFNEDSVEETAREGSSAVNRYSSAALTGDFGALQTVLAYEFRTTSPSVLLLNMTTARSSTSAATTTAASPRPSSWASTSRASRPVSSPPLLKTMPIASTALAPTASRATAFTSARLSRLPAAT